MEIVITKIELETSKLPMNIFENNGTIFCLGENIDDCWCIDGHFLVFIRGGNFNPITYEWVDIGCMLSQKGLTENFTKGI